MDLRKQKAGRSGVGSKWLLAIAWLLFLASLAGPAVAGGLGFMLVLYPFDKTPVGLVVLMGFLCLVRLTLSPYLLVLPGFLLFLLTPALIARGRSGIAALVRIALGCGLLVVWAFPAACAFSLTPAERRDWLCEEIFWGYYVFALAHTLAFVAVLLGSSESQGFDDAPRFSDTARSESEIVPAQSVAFRDLPCETSGLRPCRNEQLGKHTHQTEPIEVTAGHRWLSYGWQASISRREAKARFTITLLAVICSSTGLAIAGALHFCGVMYHLPVLNHDQSVDLLCDCGMVLSVIGFAAVLWGARCGDLSRRFWTMLAGNVAAFGGGVFWLAANGRL